LANKAQLFYYISQNYQFEQISNDLLKIEMVRDLGRTQHVYVGANEQTDQIFLYSRFASSLEVKEKKVLELVLTASRESYFGLQIIDNDFMLVHSIKMNAFDLEDLHNELGMLAISADNLEMKVTGLNDFF
jgi:hypothetical protein